jgi:hypothetical protein
MNSVYFEEFINITDISFRLYCNVDPQEVLDAREDRCAKDWEWLATVAIPGLRNCSRNYGEFNNETCELTIQDEYQPCMVNHMETVCGDSWRNVNMGHYLIVLDSDQDFYQEKFDLALIQLQKKECITSGRCCP